MVKLNSRIVKFVLLVAWFSMVCAGNRSPQYRGLGVNAEDRAEIVFFVLYVILGEIGKKLDNSYICPVYCEVNHKHRIKEDEAETKQGTDEKTDFKSDGPVVATN